MYCTKSCQHFESFFWFAQVLHSIEVPATRHRHIFGWVVLLIANISKSVPYVLRRNKHFGAFFVGTSVFFCVKHIECGYDRGNASRTWNCKIFYLVVIQHCETKKQTRVDQWGVMTYPETKKTRTKLSRQVYQIRDAVCMEYLPTFWLKFIVHVGRYYCRYS